MYTIRIQSVCPSLFVYRTLRD